MHWLIFFFRFDFVLRRSILALADDRSCEYITEYGQRARLFPCGGLNLEPSTLFVLASPSGEPTTMSETMVDLSFFLLAMGYFLTTVTSMQAMVSCMV
jgi:hypothetical protein